MMSIMKSFRAALFDGLGITALKSLLHSIQGDVGATKQILAEQDLRAAGWHAAIVNRQLKIEQSVRDIEISLGRITKQLDALALDDDGRPRNTTPDPGREAKQVRSGRQEQS